MKKVIRISMLSIALLLGTLFVGGMGNIPPAKALGGTCDAWIHKVRYTTYGKGLCSQLDSDTRARVTLDIARGRDVHSEWFTRTHRVYTTKGWFKPSGTDEYPRSARVDHGVR